MPRPATLVCLCSLVAAGFVLVWFNDRLDLWGARGAASLEGLALVFLGLVGVVVVAADRLVRSTVFEYALAPVTLVVLALTYTVGTMRLD
ncbi:MAG: hypothetical protein AB7P33_19170 [Dehalococcoidia bacterium]